MILVIDNYDSFTYNLVQYLGMLDETVQVVRNDHITVDQIRDRQPDQIVISPGPGRPEDAGITVEVIQRLGAFTPILGVCLGHQAICLAYGGEVVPAVRLMHGKADQVYHNGQGIFRNLPQGFPAGRYHSLAVSIKDGTDLLVTAHSQDGTIMAIAHKTHPVWGIQFHPESILTPSGMDLLQNFIHITSPFQETHVKNVGGMTP